MYCQMEKEKKKQNDVVKTPPARANNVVQRTKYQYQEDQGWKVIDKDRGYSPPPSEEETEILKNLNIYEVDTYDRGHINAIAEAVGWTELGNPSAPVSHRWESPNDVVSQSHEFPEEHDIHRFLRWIATRLSKYYGINSEIQCYYDTSSGRILVAANSSGDLRQLRVINNMTLRSFFEQSSQYSSPGTLPRGTGAMAAQKKRIIRHMSQMQGISQFALEQGDDRLNQIKFMVIPNHLHKTNVHAEQRILDYFRERAEGGQEAGTDGANELEEMKKAGAIAVNEHNGKIYLRSELLGGIKRPCLACAIACFTPDDLKTIHTGMLWPSKSAIECMEPEEFVKLLQEITFKHMSYKTAAGNGSTERYDSDSEDESFDAESKEYNDKMRGVFFRILGKLYSAKGVGKELESRTPLEKYEDDLQRYKDYQALGLCGRLSCELESLELIPQTLEIQNAFPPIRQIPFSVAGVEEEPVSETPPEEQENDLPAGRARGFYGRLPDESGSFAPTWERLYKPIDKVIPQCGLFPDRVNCFQVPMKRARKISERPSDKLEIPGLVPETRYGVIDKAKIISNIFPNSVSEKFRKAAERELDDILKNNLEATDELIYGGEVKMENLVNAMVVNSSSNMPQLPPCISDPKWPNVRSKILCELKRRLLMVREDGEPSDLKKHIEKLRLMLKQGMDK